MALPSVVIGLGLHITIIIHVLLPSTSLLERNIGIGHGIFGIAYTILLFFFLLPNINKNQKLVWLFTVFNALLSGTAFYLESFTAPGLYFLLTTVIVITTAVLVGRWPTYLFTAIAFLLQLGVIFILKTNTQYTILQNLSFPILAIATTETIHALESAISKQLNRLEITRSAANSLASSLEKNEAISLASNAIQKAFAADTYFVGLLNENKTTIKFALLYDEGEFFEHAELPIDNSLTGWVAKNKRPLLINDLSEDRKSLGLNLQTIGKAKLSQSWMGVPLMIGNEMIGIMAVASYRKKAFDHHDLNLLENISQLAAMALDNAAHHEIVERQSTLDSLTEVLNHRFFIEKLKMEIESSKQKRAPLSLIMLDVDNFKKYNDSHGHLVGDRVLLLLIQCIKCHIKSDDLIGRWGGEEFVIALRDTDGEQALGVAERIRNTLIDMELCNRADERISPPTVSQGIAVFPNEADEVFALIDLADQRLYSAKQNGRNEIGPADSKKFPMITNF